MEGTKGGDDEDPRFYGSGVTPEYEELLDYVNEAEKEPATIDTSELKKRLNALQKLLSENTKLRTKYPNDPLKFADSEVELNEGIEKIIQIWDKDLYAQLLELDAASIISNLLTHENIDICLATVDLVDELLDEDVANTGEYKNLLEAKRFLESLLETGCMELLIQNLYRLDESNKTEDSTGIFRTMSKWSGATASSWFIDFEYPFVAMLDSGADISHLETWVLRDIPKLEANFFTLQ